AIVPPPDFSPAKWVLKISAMSESGRDCGTGYPKRYSGPMVLQTSGDKLATFIICLHYDMHIGLYDVARTVDHSYRCLFPDKCFPDNHQTAQHTCRTNQEVNSSKMERSLRSGKI